MTFFPTKTFVISFSVPIITAHFSNLADIILRLRRFHFYILDAKMHCFPALTNFVASLIFFAPSDFQARLKCTLNILISHGHHFSVRRICVKRALFCVRARARDARHHHQILVATFFCFFFLHRDYEKETFFCTDEASN